VQYERAAVVERDDQILAASECFDKTSPTQPTSKGPSGGTLYNVWGGDYYTLDTLAKRGTPEIEESSFYFRKFRHNLGAQASCLLALQRSL
jgi:hypothetical protein